MNIQDELREGLREIRREMDRDEVSVKYSDGTVGVVEAFVYNAQVEDFTNTTPIISKTLMCNIIKQDLIDNGLPVKGFVEVTSNRIKYEATQRPMSTWNVMVVLELKVVG